MLSLSGNVVVRNAKGNRKGHNYIMCVHEINCASLLLLSLALN